MLPHGVSYRCPFSEFAVVVMKVPPRNICFEFQVYGRASAIERAKRGLLVRKVKVLRDVETDAHREPGVQRKLGYAGFGRPGDRFLLQGLTGART